jgi:hypothetical protein
MVMLRDRPCSTLEKLAHELAEERDCNILLVKQPFASKVAMDSTQVESSASGSTARIRKLLSLASTARLRTSRASWSMARRASANVPRWSSASTSSFSSLSSSCG